MINILYFLIFYSSDNPQKFNYFTIPFTNRLNQESHVKFLEDKTIETQFYLNILKSNNTHGPDFVKHIIDYIQALKSKIDSQNFKEALEISTHALKFFDNGLLKYPVEIPQNTLIQFYFWNIIANLNDKHKVKELLGLFLNATTLVERNLLESQISGNLFHKYSQLLKEQKKLQSGKYTITHAEKCTVFLNGRPLVQNVFELPKGAKSILNALCANGFYAQYITPVSNAIITIYPHMNKSIETMPPISLFPADLMDDKKFNSVVFIHWSEKHHYVQTVVVNSSNFTERRELTLQLKTKDDLMLAGDKIFQFVFNKSGTVLLQ